MKSLTNNIIRLLPLHILRYDPHTIYSIIRQTTDTSSIDNHKLIDAEVRNLKYQHRQELTDYIAKHRELRHPIQVTGFPNIESERTTVRYMVQGLAAQPEMYNLAIMMSCQQPNSIKEFNNHMQQARLIQAQATAA